MISNFIEGETLNINVLNENNLIYKIIPALFEALKKFPHGDLKENNLLLHTNKTKFSILDPSTYFSQHFFTNTNYYPLVPPFFYYPPKDYITYSDQLGIGILLYKTLTNHHPFEEFINQPLWENTWGNGTGIDPPKINSLYPFSTTLPLWYRSNGETYNSHQYIESIDSFLIKNNIIQNIVSPKLLNPDISENENELCIKLIKKYLPYRKYTEIIYKILG